MFETLTNRLQDVFDRLASSGRLTEKDVDVVMREVRMALLEADVALPVVKDFVKRVKERSIGAEVTKSLKPGQEMIGIVHRRLVALMGGSPRGEGEEGAGPAEPQGLMLVEPGPTIVMMSGLQGSGKTTTCGKLAAWLKARGKKVMVAAADLQRPAAVDQLRIVCEQVEREGRGDGHVAFHGEPDKCAEYGKAVGVAVGVCQRAPARARAEGSDVLILDTAGRLHVNDELMAELESVNRTLQPHQVMLVVDSMMGQDAVNAARAFHERLEVDGVILTKFDSDTRGGAALSVLRVTGAPIRFVGTGERFDALEAFHADRMAGRILGMGDVVSLVERAQQEVSEEEAERIAEKMAEGKLSMDDFLKQLRSLRRMGPMKQLLGMLPGVGSALKDAEIDDSQLDRLEGMVHSMTPDERDDVKLLDRSRSQRIAAGSGTQLQDVRRLVKQFDMIQKMTKQMSGMGMKGRMNAMKELQSMDPSMMPGLKGMPGFGGRGSTKTVSRKAGFKQRRKRRK